MPFFHPSPFKHYPSDPPYRALNRYPIPPKFHSGLCLLLLLLLFAQHTESSRLRVAVSPRAVIYGRNPNSPELSGGVIPEGDGPDGKGPKDTNVPAFDDPGTAEGPYAKGDKAKEGPEVEKRATEKVLEKEGNEQLEGNEVAQQGGIAPHGVLSDDNYPHDLLPNEGGKEPERIEVPTGKDAPMAHPFKRYSQPVPREYPESDEGESHTHGLQWSIGGGGGGGGGGFDASMYFSFFCWFHFLCCCCCCCS